MIDDEPPPPALSLAEAKAFLRLEQDEEDALIAGLIGAATGLCEGFTGQSLVARSVTETVLADGSWRRLTRAPVRSVDGVERLDGGAVSHDVELSSDGIGWVRANGGGTVRVRYQAGMRGSAEALPEALRQGVARLAAHLFANRDGDVGPPAAVAALWRPWRRMRLR